jgi:hypothetical protein
VVQFMNKEYGSLIFPWFQTPVTRAQTTTYGAFKRTDLIFSEISKP